MIATQAEILIDMSSQSESVKLNSYAWAELIGGSGDDHFIISNNDNSWVNGNSGWDTLWLWANYSPSFDDSLIGIEKIVFQSPVFQSLDLGSQTEGFSIDLEPSGDQVALGSGADDIYLGFDLSSLQNPSSISNFQPGNDRLHFADSNFGIGFLDYSLYDFLVYNATTGMLSIDTNFGSLLTNYPIIDVLSFPDKPAISITDLIPG